MPLHQGLFNQNFPNEFGESQILFLYRVLMGSHLILLDNPKAILETKIKSPALQKSDSWSHIPFEFSWLLRGCAGHDANGVRCGSTHSELQRFFMIFELGHGDLVVHCWSNFAMHKAAWFCTSIFSSFLTASISGFITGFNFSGSCSRFTTAQAVKVWTLKCSVCHSWFVSVTVIWTCCRLLSSCCKTLGFRLIEDVTSLKIVVT